ncbi:MAG: hypothetical protein H6733_12970 [Alphaproteobacteria bacterium]|nr:hypothetical protein [Alphaproteobacteria bacterium]
MRWRRLVAGLAVWTAQPAWAQEAGCSPLSDDEFRALVDDAYDALLDDDADKHGRLVRALQARVPCLAGPVPSEAWARFLYHWSLVRFARGQDWQDLVTAALSVDPGLERVFGPEPVKTFTPPPSAGTHARPRLPGVDLWLDGHEAPARFDLVGPHVLQVDRDGAWTSTWVDDGALPASWSPAPPATASGTAPPTATEAPGLAVRLHTGAGVAMSYGAVVDVGTAREPAAKVTVPVEVGVGIDAGKGWVRLAGVFTPLVNGSFVYTTPDGVRATHFGGGGDLAGGGTIGKGYVGGLVGLRDPGRALAQVVGGGELHRAGLRLEGRAGVALNTSLRIEPTVAFVVVMAPRLWSR